MVVIEFALYLPDPGQQQLAHFQCLLRRDESVEYQFAIVCCVLFALFESMKKVIKCFYFYSLLTVRRLYGWDKAQVDWLTIWGPLLFIPCALCIPYLNTKITFRALITISSLLVCIGTTIRAFPPSKLPPNSSLILAHCGQILCALASPMIMATPQQLSAVWFPIKERTTATSIAVVSGYAGTVVSYLAVYYIHYQHHKLLNVLQMEAVFSVILFIVILTDQIWCNDLPPYPPSVSCMVAMETQSEHHSFAEELGVILKKGKFQYFIFLCGAYQGVVNGWIGILDTIFGPDYIGFDESYVGLIGISSAMAIIFSGICFGALSDRIWKRRMKCTMISLMMISGICLVSFTLLVSNWEVVVRWGLKEQFVKPLAIGLCVVGIASNAGTYGLSYEAAVELSYPSRDIFAGALLTTYFNVFCSGFILLNNYLTPFYMNWIVCIVQFVCCGGLCLYQQEYRRLVVDETVLAARTPTAKLSFSQYARQKLSAQEGNAPQKTDQQIVM